jgi:pimeloyl-ACP methyl ester carboxylesterase
MLPTIVLVHGAFAESASWDGVIDPLVAEGHRVVAAANPLRGLAADAAAISDLVRAIEGPVVLVGHSYGGSVISNVDSDAGEIAGLVYVCAFAPDAGENCFQLPGAQQALVEPSGERPLWKDVPSWFVIGEEDRIIPAAVQRFEADRAGARRTLECAGASHVAAVSHADAVADLILEAARLPTAALRGA